MKQHNLNLLLKKIEQQENIVNQLLRIVASNNRKIKQLEQRIKDFEKNYVVEKI